jgi:hypothetical protein
MAVVHVHVYETEHAVATLQPDAKKGTTRSEKLLTLSTKVTLVS